MANSLPNPTFKRPTGIPPPRLRSPSPPRAFIEPLSPAKPSPIEPNFNYPPINNHVDFSVKPESSYTATPRARAYSTSYKGGHQRTPSTIDTLAEAALAISPSHQAHSRTRSVAFEHNDHSNAHPTHHPHNDVSEPPHKRSRSELLPSPHPTQYGSRPATSYEPANGWSHQTQSGHAYNSRVEEAALLLNFQSGGWPGNASTLPIPPAPAPRPHANSFPQDGYVRPAEAITQPQTTLLPPFNPQDANELPPPLLSTQRPVIETGTNPQRYNNNFNANVEMRDVTMAMPPPVGEAEEHSQQARTLAEDDGSRAPSDDVFMSEASEAPRSRRGWPKGKPRGPGGRKTLAEKAAKKQAASRKKTPDTKSARSKSEGPTSERIEIQEVRRKSLSDTMGFGPQNHEMNGSQHPRARSVPLETHMIVRDTSPLKTVRREAMVKSDTICAGCQTSRETANSHGELDEWISCNGCKKWFHVDCAGFKKAHEVRDVDKYFCTVCETEHGKTTYVRKSTRAHASVDYAELQRGVLKTSEESVEHHYIQPIKDGTFQFDPETFPRMRPEMITKDFFEKSATFVEPICIPAEWNPRPWAKSEKNGTETDARVESKWEDDTTADLLTDEFEYDTVLDLGQDELDMVMPQGLTVRQVCNLVGSDTPIDVIDVKTQNSGAKWTLSRWADYYEQQGDEKAIRNVISLEVSQTKLGRLLQRPKLVRDIDLQDDVWPQEEIDKGKFPKVQFYCLMSVADSYTDFHIDFGGSSVYYHILKGSKTFFFIPPKPKHLKAYEEWNDSPQQNYTFLPSITKECYRVDLHEGDTMLIPSGWIHAVWTPEDSLVIGGNFLNRMSYKNQLRVVDIEKANETPMKFRYPFFQKVMWYTAIKYMKDDPLPAEVSQLFYEGKRFERQVPVWGDFNGEIATKDSRKGAHNARFYSQAEVDGLPDLVNFIFRTVMLVMGRIEGTTADRIKRVNASIPKGYGEPLEVAKTFALWVAWKRGNEDPPAWAHPDAVLPNSKEEGPPKKLSERKLKELEKREAIAAWRVAPDRQSARVMTKNANAAAAAAANATSPNNSNSSPAAAQQPDHQILSPYYHGEVYEHSQASPALPPTAFMTSNMQRPHLSTPKTSVLGPKRVACDACRKRRIRCKHKEMVLQTSPNGTSQIEASPAAFQSQLAPELHENITVTPPKQREYGDFMNTVMDHQYDGAQMQANGAFHNGDATGNGSQVLNGQGPQPGTNAYVNANIPMTMNGVAMFGELPKKGRSKACYECRKSKRRCIHDENGNVDAAKAAEPPVPRGSVPSKKRPFEEEGGSPLLKKKQKQSDDDAYLHSPLQHHPQMQGHGVLKPQPVSNGMPRETKISAAQKRQQQHAPQPPPEEEQPPIDPNLFSMYPEPERNGAYDENSYPYPSTEQRQPYNPAPQSYNLPSLEQIANEVLVDMNGNENQDPALNAQQAILLEHFNRSDGHDDSLMRNEHSKPDDSVDSAVSLPTTEASEENASGPTLPKDLQPPDPNVDGDPPSGAALMHHELPPAHPSIETDGGRAQREPTSPLAETNTTPARPKSGASKLRLYQPPAPLSQSPETAKQQPMVPNGVNHGNSSSPVETRLHKRKRDSSSATPGARAKAFKVDNGESSAHTNVDEQTLELAKMLQQEELGLRRRSK